MGGDEPGRAVLAGRSWPVLRRIGERWRKLRNLDGRGTISGIENAADPGQRSGGCGLLAAWDGIGRNLGYREASVMIDGGMVWKG